MYCQRYLDIYDEKYLIDILLGKIPNVIDETKSNLEDKNLYYVFQHFLVKCYTNGLYKSECISFFKKIYYDILDKPYNYVDSPLIKNDVLDLIVGNKKYNDMIKSVLNSYFDVNIANQLYIKSKKEELNNEEKNQFYSFMLLHINSKNPKYIKIFKDVISDIINKNEKTTNMNEMELKFYCKYVSNFALDNRNIEIPFIIGTERYSLSGFQRYNIICMNRVGFSQNITSLTQSVCHETRHAVQEYESLYTNTRVGFELAQTRLFMKYLSNVDYDSYNQNYKYAHIELDAEKYGYWNAGVFFRTFDRSDLAETTRENRIKKLDKRNYYSYMIDKDQREVPVDRFIVLNMDEIIRNNPYELQNYPVLKQLYNVDGSKKNFSKLFYDSMYQTFDNRGVYDNYIEYGIATDELEKLNLTNLNSKDINVFFKTLGSIYRNKILLLKDYYKDDNNDVNNKQIEVTINYQIKNAFKILKYVNDNYELMIKNLDGKLTNSSIPFDFIYDLRDFSFEQIRNDKIKNNSKLITQIQLLQSLTNEVIKKFNYYFLVSRLGDFDEQELNNYISVDGLGNISFKDYLINKVLPNMDGHQQINNNGYKIHVSDIIEKYKSFIDINNNKHI